MQAFEESEHWSLLQRYYQPPGLHAHQLGVDMSPIARTKSAVAARTSSRAATHHSTGILGEISDMLWTFYGVVDAVIDRINHGPYTPQRWSY